MLKALGVGVGAAGFRDVEVVRGDDGAPAPGAVGPGRRAGGRRGVRLVARVADPHRRWWRWPSRRSAEGVDAVKPVVTWPRCGPSTPRRTPRSPRRSWSTGRGRPWPPRPCACSAAPTAAVSWWSPARATTAPTAGWRPPGCAGAGPGWRSWRRPRLLTASAGDAASTSSIDAAYGTGFRGTYRRPAGPRRGPRARRRHPLGCRRRHRRGLRRTVPGRRHRHLRGPQDRAPPGRRPAARRARSRWPTSASTSSRARIWVVEDADVARLLAPPAPRRPQVAVGGGRGGGLAGHDRGRRLCAPGPPTAPAPAWSGWASPAADPADLPASEAVGARAARRRAGRPTPSSMSERCRALVVGPGLGRAEAHRGRRPRRRGPGAACPPWSTPTGWCALGTGDRDRPTSCRGHGRRCPAAVLTPHDGEFARLAGAAPGADRIAAARSLAAGCGAVVLLKGPTTVVAEPGGDRCCSPPPGPPRLATAGTGDVLSGAIGAFVARGLAPLRRGRPGRPRPRTGRRARPPRGPGGRGPGRPPGPVAVGDPPWVTVAGASAWSKA